MKVHISRPRCSTGLEKAEAWRKEQVRLFSVGSFHLISFVPVLYREQMQKVFVGLEGRRAAVNGQQVVDVAVQVLQFAQVDLLLVDEVRQGLVERDQVLQVDPQDGHLKALALAVDAPVVAVVAA